MNFIYFVRKQYCPSIYQFKYLFSSDVQNTIAVRCLVCRTISTEISPDVMKEHRDKCKKPPLVDNQQKIPLITKPRQAAAITNIDKTQTSITKLYKVPTTSKQVRLAIDLNSLQFDIKSARVVNGDQVRDIAKCRICMAHFFVDSIKLLAHRWDKYSFNGWIKF